MTLGLVSTKQEEEQKMMKVVKYDLYRWDVRAESKF